MRFLPSLHSWVPNFTMTLPGLLCWRVKRKETEAEVLGGEKTKFWGMREAIRGTRKGKLKKYYQTAWMGEEAGEEWIHVYAWLNPFAIYMKLPQQ